MGCAPCAARPAPTDAPLPERVVLSLLLALFSWIVPVLAPFAVAVTWNAPARIRQERYSLRAERWFLAARGVGHAAAGFWAVVALGVVALWLLFLLG